MYLHVPLILFLISHTAEASIIDRSSEYLLDAVTRAHRHASRRSASFTRDLHTSFKGIFAEQKPANPGNSRVFCVSKPGLTANGASNSTISNTTSISGSSTSSAGLGPSISSSSSSLSSTGFASSPSSFLSSTGSATTTIASSSSSASQASATLAPPSPWKIVQSYQGNDFLNDWQFFTDPDPTHGTVDYLDQSDAAAGLVGINSAGHLVMSVETIPTVASVRKSVRITSQFTYTGGLVIMDSVHMPTGCGTWPSFFSNGPNWPAGGEIDIVEGVGDNTINQATIHTTLGCTMPSSSSSALNITGNVVTPTDCATTATSNTGCGVQDPRTNSYGPGFNNNNGGVYAMLWDDAGISVFFFPRNAIPADITTNAPLPDNWGQPMSFWPASTCNPFQFFNSHSAIFDNTLCGDWAGAVWGSSGTPGQEQSCAQRTGVATCQQFVQQNGSAFADAYWEVSYVQIYQTS